MLSASQRAFLNMIIPIAVRQAKKHDMKIYPSVCIAQACHESGWGTSKKMAKANAVFGIKVGKAAYKFGTAWDGDAYNSKTKEYYDAAKKTPTVITDFFRAYKDIESATEDYYDMLCHCQRYRPALNQPSPEKCIRAIVAGGYATGPEYAEHIMDIIVSHDLTIYDNGTIPAGNPYKCADKIMKSGSRGESVKWLQYRLNELGYNLSIDGVYGSRTAAAVKDYQSKVFCDGICGPLTLEKLNQ